MKSNNYIGQKYGDLKIKEFVRNVKGGSIYECECSCGNTKNFYLSNLRMGRTKSCGCKRDINASKSLRKHGDRRTRLYRIWTNMKTRCNNTGSPMYLQYGAKGIKLYDEWNESYENFKKWSLENGYRDDLTIDRINNKKGYFPDNCRWVNYQLQSRNREYAWYITIDGVTKHAKDWCKMNGINYKTAHTRHSRGWNEKDAVSIPVKK